jgi:hypothetical protein
VTASGDRLNISCFFTGSRVIISLYRFASLVADFVLSTLFGHIGLMW